MTSGMQPDFQSLAPLPMLPDPVVPDVLFSRVFHASSVAMAIVSREDARYVDVNSAFMELFGCRDRALIDREAPKIIPVTQLDGAPMPPNCLPLNSTESRRCRIDAVNGKSLDVIVTTISERWDGRDYEIVLIEDLTANLYAEIALQNAQERYRLFFESTPLPVLVFDLETLRLINANARAIDLYGYTLDELLTMSILDIRPARDRPEILELLHTLPADRRNIGVLQHVKKDGEIMDVDVNSYAFELDGRQTRLHVLRDVTEQVALESALHDRRARLEIITDLTTDVIWDLDVLRHRTAYNRKLTAVLGYPSPEDGYPSIWWEERIHLDERESVVREFGAAVDSGDTYWSTQYRFRKADGQYAHIYDRGYILRDSDGSARRVVGAMLDVTRQIEAQAAAEIAAADARQHLARDLHDSVTQSVYSLSLVAEAALRSAKAGNGRHTLEYVERVVHMAQRALREMKLLVHELRPTVVETLGLVGAIQARLDAVERSSGIRAELQTKGHIALPPDTEVQVFRIVMEALNNAIKHSQASAIWVAVRSGARAVEIEVSDNGLGMDPQEVTGSAGMGLVNMRERVKELGGRIDIQSSPGGTTIRVRLDLAEEGHHERNDSSTSLR